MNRPLKPLFVILIILALRGLWVLEALAAVGAEAIEVVTQPTGSAIQSAIDASAAKGGGVAYLPPGRYVSGPLWLKDNVELRLEAGATVVLSTDSRRAHQFDFIRMMPMARGHWAFGGTPGKPGYTLINQTAMQKLDWVFDYAARKGMNIELIIFGYGVEQGEGLWANATNQNFWIDTLVTRYHDRPNLFMWTVANEFERYPDGQYNQVHF